MNEKQVAELIKLLEEKSHKIEENAKKGSDKGLLSSYGMGYQSGYCHAMSEVISLLENYRK